MRIPRRVFYIAIVLIATALAPQVRGDALVTLDYGWGGKVRSGRWTPLFVTVSDSTPHQAELRVYAPHDSASAMDVRQQIVINPVPVTYALMIPIGADLSSSAVTLRDASTGKFLAEAYFVDPNNPNGVYQGDRYLSGTDMLAGIAGQGGTERSLESQLAPLGIKPGYLELSRLPAVVRGYDSLDFLILSAPNLADFSGEQQSAIVDWVRGGGVLVFSPGDDSIPPESPLLEILPAQIGKNMAMNPSPDAIHNAGLASRFARLSGRQLTPADDAQKIVIFNGAGSTAQEIAGYRRGAGLGEVIILPFDVAPLMFDAPGRAGTFWKKILEKSVDIPTPGNQNSNMVYAGPYMQLDQRASSATQYTMDLLGNVPGLGRFDFSYVTITLLGLMIVVGPVDWFVLKKLGRQPWTWVTTSGWILLVTFGAVYIGHLIKSGDLYYRTFRLIDQAGDTTVATHDMLCIYSPRTTRYDVGTDPSGWWEPTGTQYWGRGMLATLPFHQDRTGNHPMPLTVNVWNLQFLQGESIEQSTGAISASLIGTRDPGKDPATLRVDGTITNNTPSPISDVALRGRNNTTARIEGTIAPGATLKVSVIMTIKPVPPAPEQPQPGYTYYPGNAYNVPPTAGGGAGKFAYETCGDLALDRSKRIEHFLAERDDVICLYAMVENAAPAATLTGGGQAIEQHWEMIRALVSLKVK